MDPLTLGSFLLVTGLVGFLTWLLTRKDDHKSSDGYFLGGRKLHAGVIAGSLLLTNLSTEQLVGLNGGAFKDGLSVMAWEVIAGASLVIMALIFLPRYLKSGISTIPQFLELRFNRTTRAITSGIFIIAYAGILLPIILYTGATGLIGILDLSSLYGLKAGTEVFGIESGTLTLWITVWIIGLIGSIYAIFGGLRTVAVSDTLNGFGLLVGGILITWLGLSQIEPSNPVAAVRIMANANPEKFNSIGAPDQSVPFSTLFTGVLLLNLFYWCTNQQIIQRTLGASSLAQGQKGVLLAGVFKLLAPLIVVFPGIIAFHLFGDQIAPDKADQAYGMLVRQVLPAPLAGFFAAVIVGAILSSFNSALNSTATLFSLGVYQHVIAPKATEAQAIRVGKWFGWIIAIIAMTAAPLLASQKGIFEYLQDMNALYFIPIFAVVVAGICLRKVPAPAANLALVAGFVVIILGYWVEPFKGWIEPIHRFHFLGAVFASLIGIMALWGVITPRSEPWTQQDSKKVDLTPWRWARPVGIGLILIVLTFYIALADFSVLSQSSGSSNTSDATETLNEEF